MTEERLIQINGILNGIREIEENIERIKNIIKLIDNTEDYNVLINAYYHNRIEVCLPVISFKLDFLEMLKTAQDKLIMQKKDLRKMFDSL